MSSSKILFFLCISFVIGIFLESVIEIPQIFLWGLFILAILIIIACCLPVKWPYGHFTGRENNFLRENNLFTVLGFCILFAVLGILRAQISEFNIANDKLAKLSGQEVVLEGVIIKEPDVRETSQKIVVEVGGSKVLITTNKYPEYNYLDKIKITGKLEAPMVTEDFNYKNYLLKDHIYSVMGFPKIEVASQLHQYSIFSFLHEKILFFKQKLRQSIQNNFLPPESLVLQGMILGDKGAVGQEIKDKFKITGLSHTIAVSGMHVAVLGAITMALLLASGLWRQQAFYLSAIFIFTYVILVGAPASAVRAGIMAVIYLAGQALGRQTISARIIVLAAAIMLSANPLLLFYDVGFQLSFLAILGLIYLEPFIKIFVKNSIISTTIAAQIFTLPLIIFNFGTISLVSLITNILVLPVIYYIMLFGFLSSVVSIIFQQLGWILSLPCYFLMKYFLWVVNFFAKPWAYKVISGVSLIWVVILYVLLGVALRFLKDKFGSKFI